MTREELKAIILTVIEQLTHEPSSGAPAPGCIFTDGPHPCDGTCDATTKYAVGEEN